MGYNKFDTLPKEIGNLTNLKTLFLWGNSLTTFPKEIGKLTNLTYLSFDWQEMESIPIEIINLNCFYENDWLYFSQFYRKKQDYNNVVMVWERAVEFDPNYYSYYFNLS